MIYELGVEMNKSSLVILSVLGFVLLAYCILENFIWQKYLVYVISPWFVVILNNGGILIKNWVQSNPSRNNMASLLLLVITVFFTFVKIIMFIFYHTTCKQKLDKYKSHMLLQELQNKTIKSRNKNNKNMINTWFNLCN